VTDDGIVLQIKKKIRGMGTIETRMTVKWAELDPKEEERLARAWKPEGPDGALARAVIALARKDKVAARKALAEAGGHPLAAHYGARLGGGRKPVTMPKGAPGCPASDWPPDISTIRRVFKGKVLKWNPKTLEIDLLYGFDSPAEISDFRLTKGEWRIEKGGLRSTTGNHDRTIRHRAVFSKTCTARCNTTRLAGDEFKLSLNDAERTRALILMASTRRSDATFTIWSPGRGMGTRLWSKGATFPVNVRHAMRVSLSRGSVDASIGDLRSSRHDAPGFNKISAGIDIWGRDTDCVHDGLRMTGVLDREWLARALGRSPAAGTGVARDARSTTAPTATHDWPPDTKTVRKAFKGKVLKWDPKTLAIELAYDFSDEGQMDDWAMSGWLAPRSVTGQLAGGQGSLKLTGSGGYAFHKAPLDDGSIKATVTVSGGEKSPSCLVCADETGNFYSMTGHYKGEAFLESCNGGTDFKYHSAKTPCSIGGGRPIQISLGREGSGKLVGRVGRLRLSSDPVPARAGHVALRAYNTDAIFKDVRIKGRLSRPWLEQALGRPATCGLLGTYHRTWHMSGAVARRIDPTVNFEWGKAAPMAGMSQGQFSVRWQGSIVPVRTGPHVLHVRFHHIMAVWVADQRILRGHQMNGNGASEPFDGVAGKPIPLKIESKKFAGDARMQLRWTYPGLKTPVVVPAECLRPPEGYEKLPGPPFRR